MGEPNIGWLITPLGIIQNPGKTNFRKWYQKDFIAFLKVMMVGLLVLWLYFKEQNTQLFNVGRSSNSGKVNVSAEAFINTDDKQV